MDTGTLRQKLHNYLEVANDKKIKAMYVMMEEEIEEMEVVYTNALKKELDNRYAAYTKGNSKTLTAAQSKKRINKLLAAK